MSLDRLREIVPPPATPAETGEQGRWPEVERSLGTSLPADFKAFTATYGSGAFDGFLYLFNPFAPDGPGNLLFEREETLRAYAETRAKFPDKLPLPPFPEPGGVLPLGRSDNGDELYWVTQGDPDGWQVTVLAARASRQETFEQGVTAFLAELLAGRLSTRVFPRSFLDRRPHTFEPFG
jgi:hypothetical protein